MPTYDFRCSKCLAKFEDTCSLGKSRRGKACPRCGNRAFRVFGASPLVIRENPPARSGSRANLRNVRMHGGPMLADGGTVVGENVKISGSRAGIEAYNDAHIEMTDLEIE